MLSPQSTFDQFLNQFILINFKFIYIYLAHFQIKISLILNYNSLILNYILNSKIPQDDHFTLNFKKH